MIEIEQVYKTYEADGIQREFTFPYPYVRESDISLYIEHDGVLTKINSALYQFSPTTNKVTYPLDPEEAPVPAGDTVLIWRETDITQEEDSTIANFKSNDVERMVDKLTMICQELSDKYSRAVHFEPTDVFDTDATTYVKTIEDAKDTAVAKAAEADASATASAASATKAQKWAEGTDEEVQALDGEHSAKGWAAISQQAAESENVQTVLANMEDINTVAGIHNDVTKVSTINAAVSTVADNNAKVTTVANNISSVNTTANSIDNVNIVAGVSTGVNTVASISAAVSTVATNASDVSTVSNNISKVNTVANNISSVNAVNDNATNINAVASNLDAINGVNNNKTNINAVNSNKTNINKVANKIADVTTAATNISAITTVSGSIANVNAVGTNIEDVSAVADDLTNIDTAVANLPDLADKQNKALTTPLTINGNTETTVEGALGALNTSRAELDSNNRLKDAQNPYASSTAKGAVKIMIDEDMGYLDIYTEAY